MVFQGAGILVPLAFGVLLPFNYVINLLFGANYFQVHSWPKGFSCVVAGVIVWSIGKHLNRASKENEFALTHTFMFVKMEYWGIVYAAFGIIFILDL